MRRNEGEGLWVGPFGDSSLNFWFKVTVFDLSRSPNRVFSTSEVFKIVHSSSSYQTNDRSVMLEGLRRKNKAGPGEKTIDFWLILVRIWVCKRNKKLQWTLWTSPNVWGKSEIANLRLNDAIFLSVFQLKHSNCSSNDLDSLENMKIHTAQPKIQSFFSHKVESWWYIDGGWIDAVVSKDRHRRVPKFKGSTPDFFSNISVALNWKSAH